MLKSIVILLSICLLFMLLPIFCTLPEVADIDPPLVILVYPYSGTVLNDEVNITVEATDNRKVKKIWYTLDGIKLESASVDAVSAAKVFILDVTPFADEKEHAIQGFATDDEGNTGPSTQVLVTLSATGDVTPPVVEITNPAPGQSVADSVRIIADAYDDRIVSEVAFFIDGDSLDSDNTYPYEYNWMLDGYESYTDHTIFARAFDGTGNSSNSTQIAVTVLPALDQVPPVATLIYPLVGQLLYGTVLVQVDASDDRKLDIVEFYIDGILRSNVDVEGKKSPFSYAWNTTPLAVNSQHSLYFKAIDAAGNESINAAVPFIIGEEDIEPPLLTLLYPVESDTLSGIVLVAVDVSDNVGVSNVEYYVDGGTNGAPNFVASAAPWSYNWNTAPWADDLIHTLYIKAIDPSGNTNTVGPISYVIRN